jgi:hypothetical protein
VITDYSRAELASRCRDHAASPVHDWEGWAQESETLLTEAANALDQSGERHMIDASELPRVLEINGVFYETRETSDALASMLADARNKVEFVQAVLASAIEYAKANPDKVVGLSPTVLADIGKALGPKLPGVLHDVDAQRRERLRDGAISAAPDLLAALQFYAGGKHYHGDILVDRGDVARDALTKAGAQ